MNDFRDYSHYTDIYHGDVSYKSDYLMHYGILGMHWGIRRYQNPDGTLTNAGKRRYTLNKDNDLQKIKEDPSKFVTKDGLTKDGKKAIKSLIDNSDYDDIAKDITIDKHGKLKSKDVNKVLKLYNKLSSDLSSNLKGAWRHPFLTEKLNTALREDLVKQICEKAKNNPDTKAVMKQIKQQMIDQMNQQQINQMNQQQINQINQQQINQINQQMIDQMNQQVQQQINQINQQMIDQINWQVQQQMINQINWQAMNQMM